MSGTNSGMKNGGGAGEERAGGLVFDYELDAPPEKVWRAISMPAFREKWLPGRQLAEAAPAFETPGEEIGYRMRDDEPPFLESVVTFRIGRNALGGTSLRIVHGLADARLERGPPGAANSDPPRLMRAA